MQKEVYNRLVLDIGSLLEQGRKKAVHSLNAVIVQTYWEIGKRIVEFEQKGKEKAEYGSRLLRRLACDLQQKYGKGFSKSNTYLMRMFYLNYPKFQTLSGKLSWSHYLELIRIKAEYAIMPSQNNKGNHAGSPPFAYASARRQLLFCAYFLKETKHFKLPKALNIYTHLYV